MARQINSVLNLRNNFSGPVNQASNSVRQLQRQVRQATNMINGFGDNANKAFIKAAKSTVKWGLGTAGVLAGLAAKTGFSEAMDLEGYKMQLETATKSTKKAADIMRYAVDLANKTPYEAGELVSAASKFEAMGLSAKKYLPLVGDMASATNKGVDQAVEAMIDAQTGELERLKEFGITKAMIAKKGAIMFKKQQIINNKGQIVNQEKFNKALEAIMIEKFKGGMDKQATTLKGTWSTVTGIAKSSLAEMVGMTADGTIRQGSLYANLKKKITDIANAFTKWQKDGSIQRIGLTIQNVLNKSFSALSLAVKFVKDNINWLLPVMAGALAMFISFNIISKVVGLFKALQTIIRGVAAAQGALNVVMALNPIGLVALAIGVLVTAGILLWKNWDKVSSVLGNVWRNIKNTFTDGVNWVIDKVNYLIEKINKISPKKIELLAKLPKDIGEYKDSTMSGLSKNANGTSYFKGGSTLVGERGPEIINAPSGSSIIPADKSKKILRRNGDIRVYVTVQGNVIGNDEYANEMGGIVAKKVLVALNNI